ncbi:MAG: urease [Campylobacteraceae bacterium]|jgi:urease accessory protein|nr:urease [Campylobacteraceae bacterium]
MNTKSLMSFIQIFDASFPTGTFTHSFGLEPHILSHLIKNADELSQFLRNIITDQYQNIEFPMISKLYDYLQDGSLPLVLKLDAKLSSMLSYPYAKAYKNIGENCFAHLKNLPKNKNITKLYFDAAKERKAVCNEITILSVYAADIDMEAEHFMALWSKKNLINIAISAIKISKIKPSEIQTLLFSLDDFLGESIKNSGKKLSNFNPFFDDITYRHKSLEPRLFTT